MDQVMAWLMGLLAFIPGLGHEAPRSWNGYAELDYVYAAATGGGLIAEQRVQAGDEVAAGEVLFTLDAGVQTAQVEAATARADAAAAQVKAAEASLANLRTGARPEELQVTAASLAQAEASLALAEQNFSRAEDLFGKGNVPRSQLDQAQASLDAANATVVQLKAQLAVAQLPARAEQIAAAEANVAAARSSAAAALADAANAAAVLATRTIVAPAAGRIERVYFSAGEVIGAGTPVVSIAAAGALRIKFYVNEADRPGFHLGDVVSVSCDGCTAGLTARVDRFASDPQFTPPIIYSRDERSRLVFLTEATVAEENAVLPGQPVSVGRMP